MMYKLYKTETTSWESHTVGSLTGSLSSGDQSLAQVADVEHGRGFNIVPVLLGERIDAGKQKDSLRFEIEKGETSQGLDDLQLFFF